VHPLAIAERIVAADGDQHINAQVLQHFQHVFRVVEDLAPALVRVLADFHALQVGRNAVGEHIAGVGARGVQERAAGAVYRAHALLGERHHPLLALLFVLLVNVEIQQPGPAAPDAKNLVTGIFRAIDDLLDARVQAGDIAAAREHTNAQHSSPPVLKIAYWLRQPMGSEVPGIHDKGVYRLCTSHSL